MDQMKELMQMLMKKKSEGSDMSEQDMAAKMEVLQELMDMADSESGRNVGEGLKKVTVAAPSQKGLEMGLEKAQEMLPEMGKEGEEELSEEMMMDEEESEEDEMKKKMMKMRE